MEVVIGQNKGEQGYFTMMWIPMQEKKEKQERGFASF